MVKGSFVTTLDKIRIRFFGRIQTDFFFISFLDFQNNVMESCSSDTRGLDETVFQTPSLLHLTIGTLALMDEIERKKAKEILESAIEEFKVAKKLSIEIKGLEIMNDDPGEVDVVYAKVNDCDELQTLADGIVSKFTETGTDNFQNLNFRFHIQT